MPLNKLVGLVNFYRLSHKVTHGNAADQLPEDLSCAASRASAICLAMF
jgi:hypothetical protein